MAEINKHGLIINGLKKASGETQNYGSSSGLYEEVFYDMSTGETWTVSQCSLGQNNWTVYDNPDVIKIFNATRHVPMQELADAIYRAVQMRKEYLVCLED